MCAGLHSFRAVGPSSVDLIVAVARRVRRFVVYVVAVLGRWRWRGWLLVADAAAVLWVVPLHRSEGAWEWAGVLAFTAVCAPVFAWLLIPDGGRRTCAVGIMLLTVLVATHLASQVILAGPVRPPVADWAIPLVILTGPIVVVAVGPRWPAAISIVASAAITAWLSYQLALGDGAEPEAKVEPYAAQVLPPPPGWTVRHEQHGCGSGGCYTLTLTLQRDQAVADPGADLRRHLRDRGWRHECEHVGGLLPILTRIDWGQHCVSIEIVDTTTVKIIIEVAAGIP